MLWLCLEAVLHAAKGSTLSQKDSVEADFGCSS